MWVDGQDARELSKSFEGRIDLLITDVLMPRRSGRELAEGARAHRPGLAILFVSGHTGSERVSVEGTGGCVDFIQKPFSPQSLCGVVRRLLDTPRASRALSRSV